MKVAQECGAESSAGVASLTLIEEHGNKRLSGSELYDLYRRADELLKGSQDAEVISRLRACARIVMRRLAGVLLRDRNFNLYSAMQEFEAKLIAQALEEAGGSVTKAARLLGVKYQTFLTAIKPAQEPATEEDPAKKRLKSIIKTRMTLWSSRRLCGQNGLRASHQGGLCLTIIQTRQGRAHAPHSKIYCNPPRIALLSRRGRYLRIPAHTDTLIPSRHGAAL